MVLNRIQVVVFDYDGTLVQSNEVKKAAYRPLFPPGKTYDGWLAAALKKYPVGPRTAVIHDVLENAQWPSADPAGRSLHIKALLRQYDHQATQGAARCAIRPGALRVLRELRGKCALYLLSATPQASLERIVDERQWRQFFKKIYGWPNDKADCLKQIAAMEGVRVGDVLMVGDHPTDADAAERAGALSMLLKPDENLAKALEKHEII